MRVFMAKGSSGPGARDLIYDDRSWERRRSRDLLVVPSADGSACYSRLVEDLFRFVYVSLDIACAEVSRVRCCCN